MLSSHMSSIHPSDVSHLYTAPFYVFLHKYRSLFNHLNVFFWYCTVCVCLKTSRHCHRHTRFPFIDHKMSGRISFRERGWPTCANMVVQGSGANVQEGTAPSTGSECRRKVREKERETGAVLNLLSLSLTPP